MQEQRDIIILQAANATQHSKDGVKSEWEVKENITSEHIQYLPSYITDNDIFTILNFAKKFELIALNKGIDFQKNKQNTVLTSKIREMDLIISELSEENIRLSNILENLLPEE